MTPYFAIIFTPIFFIFSKNQKNQIIFVVFFNSSTLFLGYDLRWVQIGMNIPKILFAK